MPHIRLETRVNAPIATCFDLARNIDVHLESMMRSGERAVSGITKGLIGKGEHVTWEARHFGTKLMLTSRITEFDYPVLFTDEMTDGPFKYLRHRHIFQDHGTYTLMIDRFDFESPFGFLGRIVDKLLLNHYLTRLLMQRNLHLKSRAETAKISLTL